MALVVRLIATIHAEDIAAETRDALWASLEDERVTVEKAAPL